MTPPSLDQFLFDPAKSQPEKSAFPRFSCFFPVPSCPSIVLYIGINDVKKLMYNTWPAQAFFYSRLSSPTRSSSLPSHKSEYLPSSFLHMKQWRNPRFLGFIRWYIDRKIPVPDFFFFFIILHLEIQQRKEEIGFLPHGRTESRCRSDAIQACRGSVSQARGPRRGYLWRRLQGNRYKGRF